ncbi:MAG TPA: YceI family protein [Vicinamibacterales bacterium]|nr:YceI family protein [Vicinamibacterales bacterium]
MKIGISQAIVFCVGLTVALPLPALAQQPNVDFSVSGTSTVRSWTCTVKGALTVTPGTAAPALPGLAGGVQTATLTVPVKAFTCPNEEMTQHLLETMKPQQFPEITYRLEKYVVKGGQAEATGSLTIHGVTAPVTFPVTFAASPQGLQVSGSTRADMTKFGVEPPVVMLGLMKVGPLIRIEFKGVAGK